MTVCLLRRSGFGCEEPSERDAAEERGKGGGSDRNKNKVASGANVWSRFSKVNRVLHSSAKGQSLGVVAESRSRCVGRSEIGTIGTQEHYDNCTLQHREVLGTSVSTPLMMIDEMHPRVEGLGRRADESMKSFARTSLAIAYLVLT